MRCSRGFKGRLAELDGAAEVRKDGGEIVLESGGDAHRHWPIQTRKDVIESLGDVAGGGERWP